MKMKQSLKLLILSLAVTSLALPMSALAKCGKHHWGYNASWKGGMIYNENDGKYYNIPSSHKNMVYRSVDGHNISVSPYWSCNKSHGCKKIVSVRCETRPAYWWVQTWMPESKACYYIVR
jgi:hypothetical protein